MSLRPLNKIFTLLPQTYPATASRLNPTSRQVDIDVYDDKGNKVIIKQLWKTIDIIIGRLKTKGPEKVEFSRKTSFSTDLEFAAFSVF